MDIAPACVELLCISPMLRRYVLLCPCALCVPVYMSLLGISMYSRHRCILRSLFARSKLHYIGFFVYMTVFLCIFAVRELFFNRFCMFFSSSMSFILAFLIFLVLFSFPSCRFDHAILYFLFLSIFLRHVVPGCIYLAAFLRFRIYDISIILRFHCN